ncbi:MAG: hypothetical protein DHS20C18_55240 [Saprospiraceae bacterium]|nr:MAG: hypothetical protein DHS20C18_55240 [Saprospiraceae bacterium]
MKLKVGIFFGGPSREREISFAGGRTVYDNLNKALFEAVPIFVDSHCNFILLDWQYIYKGTIRDFYPPVDVLPPSPHHFQIYLESLGNISKARQEEIIQKVGRRIDPEELPQLINVAFLALHGFYGEDGQIQQQLENLNIPYTGSGVRASEIGMDKALQKELMQERSFDSPKISVVERGTWEAGQAAEIFAEAQIQIGFPMVIRPANQGSSIGVAIIEEEEGFGAFRQSVDSAFFREILPIKEWHERNEYEREEYVRLLSDIREGIGFPLDIEIEDEKSTIYHPEQLLAYLNEKAPQNPASSFFYLSGHLGEEKVILESFINGREFSCIVIRKEDGGAVALPPTEIRKGKEVFDYRAKYMPGMSRKLTPIDLPVEEINKIRRECERLFTEMGFQTYARIDGFFTRDKRVFLNDPNTTSGMLPSSFFFHQAAEIGLNPSQFLTYIIRISLQERMAMAEEKGTYRTLISHLDSQISEMKGEVDTRKKIGVILGGYSFERHISIESGRNVFEKLASSEKYAPLPIFLTGAPNNYELIQLPINLLLKDNADDIRDKIQHWEVHPVIEEIKAECADITQKYASELVVFAPESLRFEVLKNRVDAVFIALHGRPGEDGQLQMQLEAQGIPYNGSGVRSSSVTIDKYKTLQTLKRNGFSVTNQLLVRKSDFLTDQEAFYAKIEKQFAYPMVVKPVDDGCSSAVKIINRQEELTAFAELMFRAPGEEGMEQRKVLKLRPKEEFPYKNEILIEQLITANGASHFLEITGGLLTHYQPDGNLRYEVFDPSEALASGEVLSMEEKFLAGEGQNITPARFAPTKEDYQRIASQVKGDLEKVARVLNVQGYARIDAFVRIYDNLEVETIIVEVNSLPGMTPATCIFHQAALNGYQPYNFIDQILEFAFARQRRNGKLSTPEPATISPSTTTEQAYTKPDMDYSDSNSDWKTKIKAFFTPIWLFLKSTVFLKNLGMMLAFFLVLFLITTNWLKCYTKHGESMQVDSYIGMDLKDAKRKAKSRSLSVVVLDSIFDPDNTPNEVYQQIPSPLSRIKENRTIYLSVYGGVAPEIPLPELKSSGYDYERYASQLKNRKIKSVVRERKFDNKLEEKTILNIYYQDKEITENDLKKGFKVPQGSTLEFIITKQTTEWVILPNLVCSQYDEGTFLITANKLSLGSVYGDVIDKESAYIWKQEPAYSPDQRIRIGQQIDIYLTDDRPRGCPED